MNTQNMKKKLIDEICLEKGIEKVDISYDWISVLKKDGIERKLVNYNFYLNSGTSIKLAKDKYSTYELLHYYGIPMVKHEVLFNEKMVPNCEAINQDYQCLKNNEKQVIKANDLAEGKEVYLASTELKKRQLVDELFEREIEAVVVCPYQEIEYEYRVLFLYGEVIYIYKKQKPFVIGDGTLKLQELIARDVPYLQEPNEDLNLQEIPPKGEKIMVGWKHNLSNGAMPLLIDTTDLYYAEVKKLALQVGKIMELNYGSIDMSVTKDKKVYVMEVNSNVTIHKFCQLVPNGYEIGKTIYSKVIDKLFEKGEKYEIEI